MSHRHRFERPDPRSRSRQGDRQPRRPPPDLDDEFEDDIDEPSTPSPPRAAAPKPKGGTQAATTMFNDPRFKSFMNFILLAVCAYLAWQFMMRNLSGGLPHGLLDPFGLAHRGVPQGWGGDREEPPDWGRGDGVGDRYGGDREDRWRWCTGPRSHPDHCGPWQSGPAPDGY